MSLKVLVCLALVGFLWGLDLGGSPDRQLTGRAMLGTIRGYQLLVSPRLTRAGVSCRFTPTCSRYAHAVIERHGALGGGRLTAWRLLRCAPWTEPGTNDPPP